MSDSRTSRLLVVLLVASVVWATAATVALMYAIGRENLCGPPTPFTVAAMTERAKYRIGDVVNITLINFAGVSYEGWPRVWIFNWPEENHRDRVEVIDSPNKVVAHPGEAFANLSWTPTNSGLFEIYGMIIDSREYVLTQSNSRVCMINVVSV